MLLGGSSPLARMTRGEQPVSPANPLPPKSRDFARRAFGRRSRPAAMVALRGGGRPARGDAGEFRGRTARGRPPVSRGSARRGGGQAARPPCRRADPRRRWGVPGGRCSVGAPQPTTHCEHIGEVHRHGIRDRDETVTTRPQRSAEGGLVEWPGGDTGRGAARGRVRLTVEVPGARPPARRRACRLRSRRLASRSPASARARCRCRC